MSRASDIAMVRSARTGRMNFQWSQADVVFDDTREHEVMSRLVEWRARWWADTTGTHGSRLNEIKNRSASTKSDAEAATREALADMVKRGDIVIEKVVVTLPARGQDQSRFQCAVYWSVPGSGRGRVTTV